MSFLRAFWRAVLAFSMFAYAAVEVAVLRPRTRPERAAWLSRFCSRVLRRMDIHITVRGPVPQTGAVISNHLSFFDILLHSAVRPCVFVSKAELRKTPLLGWLSFMAGTVYVERGVGGQAEAAATVMAKGFRDGLPVVFFPEGTTGTGEVPAMHFRSGLIAQSMAAGAPITPSFITYALSARDLAEGKNLRDDLHWGKQGLLQLAWRGCKLHRIDATIQFAESPVQFSAAGSANRKIAAEECRKAVIALSGVSLPAAV